jgi:hypothetical protein
MTVDMSDGLIDYRHLLPIVGLMATYAYLSIRDIERELDISEH